jgi:hypothetical protein
LKAAIALQAMTIESPVKSEKKPIIDDARCSSSPVSETENGQCEELDRRTRFVGDIDLPESGFIQRRSLALT